MKLELIKDLVECEFRINISEKTRKRNVVYVRNIYFKLCREFTYESYQSIANILSINHATVIHGENVCNDIILKFEPKYAERYFKLKKILNRICETSYMYLDDNDDVQALLQYKGKYKNALLETRIAINKERELRKKYSILLEQMKEIKSSGEFKDEFQV